MWANDAFSLNLSGREDVDMSHVKDVLLSPKKRVTIGCWNVKTLLEPGALDLLLNELGRFRWDLIGIAEIHWKRVMT